MDDFVSISDHTSEAGVISGIVFSRSMHPSALCLAPDDFTDPPCRMAFEALRTAHSEGRSPEYIVIENMIGQHAARDIEKKAMDHRLSPNHLTEYINAVIDSSVRRKVIERCRNVAAMAMNRNVNQMDILASLNHEDLGITTTREPKKISDLIKVVKEEMRKPFDGCKDEILHCGIQSIDNAIGGFSRGQVTTICAVPACGKSALILNIALSAAKKNGMSSLIASLEDVATMQAMRLMASEYSTLFNAIRRREMSEEQMVNTFTYDLDFPIFIEDAPYQSPESIRAMAISHKARHGQLDYLIIDHLIEMADESDPVRSTARAVKAIRDIAKEINCHVFLLTQPKKNTDRTKPLVVSDMVESGRVEQVSRGIWLLYRAESQPDIMKVNVVKNTNGAISDFALNFDGSRMQVW